MAQRPGLHAPIVRDAMAYVLAGGRGSRLLELTDIRAKPAVYFGGKSRIIDFALSNALNSGIRRIGVAAGTSFVRNVTRDSTSCRPRNGRVTAGTRAPPTRFTRTSISSKATTPNTLSSWPATTFIRWTMR
jgi:hypothetical protein